MWIIHKFRVAAHQPQPASETPVPTGTMPLRLERVIQGRMHELVKGSGHSVRRVLPYHQRRSVGPWVFLDHAGPAKFGPDGVGPHPHIGLATLTWLYEGSMLHRDSTGVEQVIRPGEVNFMVSGKGIVHAERGVPGEPGGMSHGLQFWLALDKEFEMCEPKFHHLDADEVPCLDLNVGVEALLIAGSLAGLTSPLPTTSPTLLVDISMECGTDAALAVRKDHEIGLYCSIGNVSAKTVGGDEVDLAVGDLAVFVDDSRDAGDDLEELTVDASTDSRLALLGGQALPEKRHMFWNFVATSKELIEQAAKDWQELDPDRYPDVINERRDDFMPLPAPRKA